MCIPEVLKEWLGNPGEHRLERVNGGRETMGREYCSSARLSWEYRSLEWRDQSPETFGK